MYRNVASLMNSKLPSFWLFAWVSLMLCLIGWGGLISLVITTLPNLAPRWLFFFLLTVACSGLALPFVYFLNRRFPSTPLVEGGVILREAMWFGVYGSLISWLQLGRVLTPGLAVVLAVGLVLVEYLLRLSERSSYAPGRAVTIAAGQEDQGAEGDAPDPDEYGDEDD